MMKTPRSSNSLTRRDALSSLAATTLCVAVSPSPAAAAQERRFRYSLNTATIMGQKLPVTDEVRIAAEAGYDGIEPWIRNIDAFTQGGGKLEELKRRIADRGLALPSAIGFMPWVVDDPDRRKQGLEEAKRCFDIVARLGGVRLAAPPTGATDVSGLSIAVMAERYRALLELGDTFGVTPELEVWGFSKTLNRLGDAAAVVIESQHPRACVLADVYHLRKGGSGFEGVRVLSAESMPVFHVNDYPADIPPEKLADANRVYPGDGQAPLKTVFGMLRRIGFNGYLSLELFNREYWMQDPLEVARTGLRKMRAVAEAE